MKLKIQNLKINNGFTLIEMLVSVAIFATVMVIALGALLSMSESDRKAQSLKSVINNLNFALDSMSRSMRTGSVYHCDVAQGTLTNPRDCNDATGASSVAFTSAGGQVVAYCLGNGASCSDGGTSILRSVGGNPYLPITAPEVSITYLRFFIVGATIALQPHITILLSGNVLLSGSGTCGTTAKCSEFNLQTSVTQRIYDQ